MGRRLKISTANENLRETILDSALKLFTTKGYFNTSIQDIRRDANISIGAVYHYFASKEELASALYDSLLEKITVTQVIPDSVIRPLYARSSPCP